MSRVRTTARVQDINEKLHEVDFAKHFTISNFDAKIKQTNGYQSHVVSPELAMRTVVGDAFKDAAPVAQWMIVQLRSFLTTAAAESAKDVVESDPDHRSNIADMIVQV